ncbi:GAMYB transcription factor [Trema orientale]|uniref:GAMYB transcription factor n=1 Tax=Trema orientale TaxID=63057 RepID=A0A2P5F3Q8_TREOI|nr:GAMYB transcription factor [Trema orientale]
MVKEQARKCSHCGKNGHNSRTCNNINNNNVNMVHGNRINGNSVDGGNVFKLFGVTIMEKGGTDSMKKSLSMDNLAACGRGGAGHGNDVVPGVDHEAGYLSDGLIHNKRRKAAHERKRGKPWTEEEHRTFLTGLNKLGKGDWRGIATQYVTTRTPSQVASHAQKYFLRQVPSNDKKKRRTSLFDMTFEKEDHLAPHPYAETSSKAGSPLVLAENNHATKLPSEVLNRFPHLCLDNYPALVPSTATSNYQLVPYGMGMPGNVQPWPVINLGGPSYLYSNILPQVYGKVESCDPVVGTHPSGIPPPRSPPSSPSKAARGASSADQREGLDLKIGQPQSKQSSELSSPSSGPIIRVT